MNTETGEVKALNELFSDEIKELSDWVELPAGAEIINDSTIKFNGEILDFSVMNRKERRTWARKYNCKMPGKDSFKNIHNQNQLKDVKESL